MKKMLFLFLSLLVAAQLLSTPDKSAAHDPSDPLDPFEFLIGGKWYLGDTYQVFEWGVGKRSIRSRSYFVNGGNAKLVSEGIWVWHPGSKEIKGIFTCVEMPVVFLEYSTRINDAKMMNELKSYDAQGVESHYNEVWDFTDDNHYKWRLLQNGKEVMSGDFERRD